MCKKEIKFKAWADDKEVPLMKIYYGLGFVEAIAYWDEELGKEVYTERFRLELI